MKKPSAISFASADCSYVAEGLIFGGDEENRTPVRNLFLRDNLRVQSVVGLFQFPRHLLTDCGSCSFMKIKVAIRRKVFGVRTLPREDRRKDGSLRLLRALCCLQLLAIPRLLKRPTRILYPLSRPQKPRRNQCIPRSEINCSGHDNM